MSMSTNDQCPTIPLLGHFQNLLSDIRAMNGQSKACADVVWGHSALDEDGPSFIERHVGLTLRRFNPPGLVLPKFAAQSLF